MARPILPADGGCRCGRVRFQLTAPLLMTLASHCPDAERYPELSAGFAASA